ncbi:phosphatidylinositol transfer protein 3-like [Triticum dicoccoides]|uniref:phosphatidylinositol transfer protein 3-like n=1 Tax=Triticum dicoccoides TaxID=85692 RepID=UPI00162E6F54|nr:phosphatidylinositol transfer protein 3-like [Triticum dicoccoides]
MDFGTDERQHSHGDGGDAAEWKKVVELRAVAEAQDPAAKEEDDFVLRRFLRARDYNIGKASMMLLQYLAWKRVAKPHGSISDEEVRGEIAKKRVDMQGFDCLGRPMAYIYGARHFPARRDLDGFKRYVAYVLDKICTRLPVGQEKFAAVIDLRGWGYANCDIRGYVAALDIMQSYYPERLGRVFLIHVPYMFMAAWKMVYPFIDEKTKKKFVFVADRDLDATLRDAIDESQLPEEYGSKLKL